MMAAKVGNFSGNTKSLAEKIAGDCLAVSRFFRTFALS
jgi:hypothetical protein